MLDHVFVQSIAAFRHALDAALLERHAIEERFELELMLGDITWETSYTLPGEGVSPRAQAGITFEWSTWSQSAYRSMVIGEGVDEPPEIAMEIVFRLQRLAEPPDPAAVLAVLPNSPPTLGPYPFERRAPTVEQQLDDAGVSRYAVEIAYEGVYELTGESPDADMTPLGSWIASSLVRLTDMGLEFLPPDIDVDLG